MKILLKLQILEWAVFGALLVLVLALFHVQVIRGGHYRRSSEHNRIRLIRLEAPRGNIYDRSGSLLATNRPAYSVYVIPEDFDPGDFSELSRLLGFSEDEIRKRITKARTASFTPVLLKQDISKELAIKIEERRPRLSGVFIHVQALRFYPAGENAAHLVGYIGRISEEEYEWSDKSVYYRDSWVGRSGVEKIYDLHLRGEDGGRQIEVDARGVPMQLLGEKKPEPGSDLRLTVDVRLEAGIRSLLRERRASAIMMDLETGAILAAVSTPGFDPNVFVTQGKNRERIELMGSREQPLVNRGFSGAYPPGSVFKLVTALAALEAGVITPHTTFTCPGYFRFNANSRRFKCWFDGGHGRVDLYTAIERSCNVYFYNTGRLLGEKRLAEYARKLGFGSRVEWKFPASTGLVPDAQWKRMKYHDAWYPGDTVTFAIGQSYLLVTPLQILNVVAMIATDGSVIEPKVVQEEKREKEPKKVGVSKETFRTLRRGMLRVVHSDRGTGQFAQVDFIKLAAKTGTAQAPPGAAHAWLGGFFPYEHPKIALVVFVERGESGGITAAKMAKETIKIWNNFYGSQVS